MKISILLSDEMKAPRISEWKIKFESPNIAQVIIVDKISAKCSLQAYMSIFINDPWYSYNLLDFLTQRYVW